MRLRDLNPSLQGTLDDGVLMFDCPFPACHRGHPVRVYVSRAAYHERLLRDDEVMFVNACKPDGTPVPRTKVKVWQASGEFPDTLTLSPSIDIIEADEQGNKIRTLCWHGHVTNGDAA